MVSTTAQDQAENLTVHIPDAIRHDLSAMSIYVNDIRHQYAICLTQEELTLRSLQRINARCHNRQSSGQGVPSQLLEQRNGSRSRLQKCAENLNIIRNLANGTPERAEQTIVILPDDLRPYFRSSVDQLFSKHPPENWRGYQGPFERTQRGELKKTSFTADELRVFFDYHIKDGVPLKLWIQKTPQISDVAPQVVRNLDCRFALCACQDQSGSTVPRDIRVAFDEPSKFGDVGRPRNVVGYVHLLCLEQKFHFPTLIRKIGSIDVEVFQNCFGLSFNDSPGLICKPAIAIAKKFIWASIFQTLDACCPDYPRATSTEHFPTGFTGKDELSLTYKMQWAHRVSASLLYTKLYENNSNPSQGSIDEEHGWKGQQAAMKKQKLTSLSAPINDTTRTDTSSLYDTDSSANSQYSYLQPRADNEQFFELNPTSDAQPSSCKHSNLGSTTSDLTNNQSSEFYADLATQLQGESSTLPPVGPPSHEDDDYDMDEDYPRFPVVTNKPLGKHTAQSSSSATAGRPFSSLLADDLRAAKERVFARNKTEKNTRAPPSQNFLTNEAERWNTTFQETDSNCDPNSDGVNSSEAHGQDPWHLWKQLVSDRGNI